MTNERDNAILTAYAAGELGQEASAAVEARLAGDPAARAAVREIRQAIDLLRKALQGEAAGRLGASQRSAIEAAARRKRPSVLAPAGLAAAAAVLVAAGIFAFRSGGDTGPSAPAATNGRGAGAAGMNTPVPVGSLPPKEGRLAARGTMAALPISLPKPLFGPTPQPPKGEPNMGPPRKGKRPPFFAPRGAVNLARGKPVASSDGEPIIGELKCVTDGVKDGRDGSFVELAPGKQWIRIDLQAEAVVYAVVVWHYHKDIRAYRDVVVQVARDQDFIESRTVFNNDHDNSSGLGRGKDKGYMEDYQGKLIDCKGVRGRYVRLWSNENTSDESNHYIEVEVYGRHVK